MQVVIDIDERDFSRVVNTGKTCDNSIYVAFKNGIVLPSGHGDLIDRDKIAFDNWSVDGHVCVNRQDILNMPVIVPREGVTE
jgi:hypothetical protein